ncbi:MAG TPA: tetratricopeptide repeat protein [Bryobacteraceae bacterium]|nr:tetratricopeptide repeat protein [Bryobacteraceae bacterium]
MAAAPPEWTRANQLYQRTEYRESLKVLENIQNKDAQTWQLIGQDFYMLGEYKKATEVLEKAIALDPNNPKLVHWLGRAYGRRAETSNPLAAPGWANKTRQMLEKSVELDPTDTDALGDLLDYYLDAPGFLGGGLHKAEALAHLILKEDPAEGHYAVGLVAERRKEYEAAEQQFRRAAELAPRQVGRVLVLARYLANHGREKESDALFEQAARMAPNSPKVMFERANTYIHQNRDLGEARKLLEHYMQMPLTPDDPPKDRAQALLKKLGSG